MNIDQLRKFRKLPRHEKLIEVYVHGQGRWLFATDGNRAVGIKTDQYIGIDAMEDRHSNAANVISGYFSRSFKKMDPQHFMSWLFSGDTCSKCKGTKKIVCSTCDGSGDYECEECEDGTCQVDCNECDGSGTRMVDCDKCDGNGEIEEDCNECSGTAKITNECSECDGSGENEQGESCSSCDGEGKIEEDCDECVEGKVSVSCPDCDGDSEVEEDCEECDCGKIEKDCEDCNGSGRVACNCDGEENCTECLDLGRLSEITVLDLSLVKDLGMSVFNEMSVTEPREAVVFRGHDVMAVVMPYWHNSGYRDYKVE